METLEWQWCGRHVMLEWLAQEWEGENQSTLRPLWPPALLAGPCPTLTLPCFPTQRSSSHWPKSRANSLQYNLQTLQLQKLKICSILLRSNKALLPSFWLIHTLWYLDVFELLKCWMSSSQLLSPHSCWSLPRNGWWLLTNAINSARLSNGIEVPWTPSFN